MDSPNDPDPGRFVIGALWFCGWPFVLLFYVVVMVYTLIHPRAEWDYPMGGDV